MTESTSIYRKKFPVGYLFHMVFPDPGLDAGGCLFWLLFIPLMVVGFVHARKSYLKTSPDGLELYWCPEKKKDVKWSDVVKMERNRDWGLKRETLYVNRPVMAIGRNIISIGEKARKHMDRFRSGIPIWQFQGWPDGGLALDLRKYIPHIVAVRDAKEVQG